MLHVVIELFLVACILAFLVNGSKRDDSDDPLGGRSGLWVYTDHKTGCQYLGTSAGAITPRLDKDGNIVCKERTQ